MNISDSAKKLSRNPLGIIALFIVLIYGFATLLFGLSGDKISNGQKWAFTMFIVIFPIIVLYTFFKLVKDHHRKLYAPMDYRDENHFFDYSTPEERKIKLDAELHEVTEVPIRTEPQVGQRSGPEYMADFRKKLENAEQKALNKLRENTNKIIKEGIYFGGNNKKRTFDGVIEENNSVTLIEVKYIRSSFINPSIVESIIYKAATVKQDIEKEDLFSNKKSIKLLLIFVVDMNDDDILRLKNRNERFMQSNLIETEVIYYKYDDI